jgi:D-alanine-D-alanine ligase
MDMRIKVGVFFGGISVEHEVSVISALQAIHAMDQEKYEPIPIYISKDMNWYTGDVLLEIDEYKDLKQLLAKAHKILVSRNENDRVVLNKYPFTMFGKKVLSEIDVAFPVMHGTFGEDGALQGFFELNNIPYVGCDVTSSAIGMDKLIMKKVLRDSAVPILDYVWFYSKKWIESGEAVLKQVEEQLGFPVIVKPANLGSSVGISKAANLSELEDAVELAMTFANKIVVEKMVTNLKEVNCSVLGDYESVEASVCEEVVGTEGILSYKDKYQNEGTKGMSGSERKIPAEISAEMEAEVKRLAKETFLALGCSGVSRIDFLIDKETEAIYVNEINTIPGSLSFYLWEPAGKSFKELTSDMIQLALKRQREKNEITFTYDSNLFALHGGAKGGKLGAKG